MEKVYEVFFGGVLVVYFFLVLLVFVIVEVMKGGKICEVEEGGEKEIMVF